MAYRRWQLEIDTITVKMVDAQTRRTLATIRHPVAVAFRAPEARHTPAPARGVTAPVKFAGGRAALLHEGAFGFPQPQASILCDTGDLRVSFFSDVRWLYVQALLWKDTDQTHGFSSDGRPLGDNAALSLDVDADGTRTPRFDRVYLLAPLPALPGLRHQVVLSASSWTGIDSSSEGRGAVRHLDLGGGQICRCDNFLIPLSEIGRRPGDPLRLAYYGASPFSRMVVNSVGHEGKFYYSFALPLQKYHSVMLADRPSTLDASLVPEDRPVSHNPAPRTPAVQLAAGTHPAGPPAPHLTSPEHGARFSHFPRTLELRWGPVAEAARYAVQVDCFHCCESGRWCTDVGGDWRVDLTPRTEHKHAFVGAQPGRWRVRAFGADGSAGPWSNWREFSFSR